MWRSPHKPHIPQHTPITHPTSPPQTSHRSLTPVAAYLGQLPGLGAAAALPCFCLPHMRRVCAGANSCSWESPQVRGSQLWGAPFNPGG